MKKVTLKANERKRKAPELRDMIFELITSLAGQNRLLTIPAEFVHYTGSLDAALFLSQLLYLSNKGRRADGFIYKTYSEWEEEICLSEYKVRKAAQTLKGRGILETKVMKANGSPTVHYKLLPEKFSESFLEFLKNRMPSNSRIEPEESEESITETTTEEILTELTSLSPTAAPIGDGGKVNGEYENEIASIREELLNKLQMLVPVIPRWKNQEVALDELCRLVQEETCSVNTILLCAESLLDDYDKVAVTPISILNRIGTFLAQHGNDESLIYVTTRPELYGLSEEDTVYGHSGKLELAA